MPETHITSYVKYNHRGGERRCEEHLRVMPMDKERPVTFTSRGRVQDQDLRKRRSQLAGMRQDRKGSKCLNRKMGRILLGYKRTQVNDYLFVKK